MTGGSKAEKPEGPRQPEVLVQISSRGRAVPRASLGPAGDCPGVFSRGPISTYKERKLLKAGKESS